MRPPCLRCEEAIPGDRTEWSGRRGRGGRGRGEGDWCSNARRARAGRGAEEKKARCTGHARPDQKMNGGLARHSAGTDTTRSRSGVGRLMHGPVPRPFSPPPLEHGSRPSRDTTKPSPRGLFARSSNDVRSRCCAIGDARRAHERTRVDADRLEPRTAHALEGVCLSAASDSNADAPWSGIGLARAMSARTATGALLG